MQQESITPQPSYADIEKNFSASDYDQAAAYQPEVHQAEIAALELRLKSASSWFYTIAALSIVNSIITLFGGTWHFIFGLGVTSVADAFILHAGSTGKAIGFVFTLLVAAVFVIFGVLARKRFHWVYITGMVAYALDGLISLLIGDWLGAGFHAFALFQLFGGVAASRQLHQLRTGN